MVTYESGYGAEADGIKMYLAENEKFDAESLEEFKLYVDGQVESCIQGGLV